MAKVLYLLNAFYPINPGETFLANEIDYLKGFERVYVCPIFADKNKQVFEYKKAKSITPDLVSIPDYSPVAKLSTILRALSRKDLREEFKMLRKDGRATKTNYLKGLKFVAHCLYFADSIWNHMQQNIGIDDEIILYSYWMNHDAYVAVLLKECIKKNRACLITRGHRVDIYEYADSDYIPMRRPIFSKADMLCPIAEDGKRYLIEKYGVDERKISIQRLGTEDHGTNITEKGTPLRIVSCSWMRKVKRLDLLLDALSLVDFPVVWTHYGDGEEYQRITEKSQKIDNPNLQCQFMGATPNEKVLHDLGTLPYDVFINVSSSEGVPVSIMEAMSFGLPIIATDVGGSREIVRDGENGYLLRSDCSKEDIVRTLTKFSLMTEREYQTHADQSRLIWEDMCWDRNNYRGFRNLLSSI